MRLLEFQDSLFSFNEISNFGILDISGLFPGIGFDKFDATIKIFLLLCQQFEFETYSNKKPHCIVFLFTRVTDLLNLKCSSKLLIYGFILNCIVSLVFESAFLYCLLMHVEPWGT